MSGELTFRLLLLLLFLGFVLHRGYYSRKLRPSEEETIAKQEGGLAQSFENILSIIALLAVTVYVVSPAWIAWAALPLTGWVRWLGVGVALFGFGLLQWAHMALGRNWSDTPRLMVEQTVTASGPYRWVRHPIYSAFLMIMSATLLISANWLVGGLWIGATALNIVSRIRFEEAAMHSRFGEQYAAYSMKTGRLFPRF